MLGSLARWLRILGYGTAYDNRIDDDEIIERCRCLECNSLLVSVDKERIRLQVPAYVFKTQSHFKRCPGCQRIYWGGTHRRNIYQRLKTRL